MSAQEFFDNVTKVNNFEENKPIWNDEGKKEEEEEEEVGDRSNSKEEVSKEELSKEELSKEEEVFEIQASDINEEERAEKLEKGKECKTKGNKAYMEGANEEAFNAYSEGLAITVEERLCINEEEKTLRSQLFGNRAAVHLAEEAWEKAINDCTSALSLAPNYVKVLRRRATAFEKIEKYQEALNDLKSILELQPSNKEVRQTSVVMAKKAEEKFEEDKEEMLTKVKQLGNTLLGKFGLSTDNFQMVKDEKTGGYSVQFNQGQQSQGGVQQQQQQQQQ